MWSGKGFIELARALAAPGTVRSLSVYLSYSLAVARLGLHCLEPGTGCLTSTFLTLAQEQLTQEKLFNFLVFGFGFFCEIAMILPVQTIITIFLSNAM